MGILDYSAQNPWLSDALATISQGLLSYGSGNPNALAQLPQYLAERQRYRRDDQRQAKLDERQNQIFQMQMEEQQRTRNKEAAQRQAALGLLGTQAPNGMSQAQFGGAPTSGGLLGSFDPPVQDYIKTLVNSGDYGSAIDVYGKLATAKPEADKLKDRYINVGGSLIDLNNPTSPVYVDPKDPKEPRAPNWITLVGPDGKEVTVDGNSPQAAQYVSQGYTERRSSMFPALPTGYQLDPTNPAGLAPVPGGPADPKNPLNVSDQDKAAAGFADRLAAADAIISTNTAAGTSYTDAALSSIPFIGNTVSSQARQQYDQAKRDFINAQLRKESGATIQPSEFESAEKQYFPQPGDGEDVIKQKAQARKIAIQNMLRNASGAAKETTNNDPLGIR